MAVAARKIDEDYAYMPATRVYSNAESLRAQREEALEREKRQKRAERAAIARQTRREALNRLFLLVTIGVTMASVLLILLRYASINHAYASVNTLRSDIATVKREITGLNVELNSAVSMQEARDAAEEAGLGYPRADQIVKVIGQNGYSVEAEGNEQIIEVLE